MIKAKDAHEVTSRAIPCDLPYDYFEEAKQLCEIEKLIYNASKNGDMETTYERDFTNHVRRVLEESGYIVQGHTISWRIVL